MRRDPAAQAILSPRLRSRRRRMKAERLGRYALEPLTQLPGWDAENHVAALALVRRGAAAPRAGRAMPSV